MRILEEIYLGEYRPFERNYYQDKRYQSLAEAYGAKEDVLASLLPGGKRSQVYSEYINAFNALNCYSELLAFIDGYRLGTHLMHEAFLLPDKE